MKDHLTVIAIFGTIIGVGLSAWFLGSHYPQVFATIFFTVIYGGGSVTMYFAILQLVRQDRERIRKCRRQMGDSS